MLVKSVAGCRGEFVKCPQPYQWIFDNKIRSLSLSLRLALTHPQWTVRIQCPVQSDRPALASLIVQSSKSFSKKTCKNIEKHVKRTKILLKIETTFQSQIKHNQKSLFFCLKKKFSFCFCFLLSRIHKHTELFTYLFIYLYYLFVYIFTQKFTPVKHTTFVCLNFFCFVLSVSRTELALFVVCLLWAVPQKHRRHHCSSSIHWNEP